MLAVLSGELFASEPFSAVSGQAKLAEIPSCDVAIVSSSYHRYLHIYCID